VQPNWAEERSFPFIMLAVLFLFRIMFSWFLFKPHQHHSKDVVHFLRRIFNPSSGGGMNFPGLLQKLIDDLSGGSASFPPIYVQPLSRTSLRRQVTLSPFPSHIISTPLHKSCEFTLVSFTNPRTPFRRRCEFPPASFQPAHSPQPTGRPLQPPPDLRRERPRAVQRGGPRAQHRGVAATDNCAGRNA
jgi:hypothetical protein